MDHRRHPLPHRPPPPPPPAPFERYRPLLDSYRPSLDIYRPPDRYLDRYHDLYRPPPPPPPPPSAPSPPTPQVFIHYIPEQLQEPKHVTFELLNPQTPLQQHLQSQGPVQAIINPHDTRRSINRIVRKLYSLNNGEVVSFEKSAQETFQGTYDNFSPNSVTYVRITSYQHRGKAVGVRFNRSDPAPSLRVSPLYEPHLTPPPPPARTSSALPPPPPSYSESSTQHPCPQQPVTQTEHNGPLWWFDPPIVSDPTTNLPHADETHQDPVHEAHNRNIENITDSMRRAYHLGEIYEPSDLIEVHPLGSATPVLIERHGGSTAHVYYRTGDDVLWRIEKLKQQYKTRLQELTTLEEAGEGDGAFVTEAERLQIYGKIARYGREISRLQRRIERLGGGGEAMDE